jgi:hypothetical protein
MKYESSNFKKNKNLFRVNIKVIDARTINKTLNIFLIL